MLEAVEGWLGRCGFVVEFGRADNCPVAPNNYPFFDDRRDRLGIGQALMLKNPGSKQFRRVSFKHRTGSLDQDWPGVILIIAQVYGASGNFAAVGNDCLVDMMAVHSLAPKRWQERWMDVDHPTGEPGRDFNSLEVSCQNDQVRLNFGQKCCELLARDGAAKHDRYNSDLSSTVTPGARRAGYHPNDPSIQRPRGDVPLQVDHGAAPTRKQDTKVGGHCFWLFGFSNPVRNRGNDGQAGVQTRQFHHFFNVVAQASEHKLTARRLEGAIKLYEHA